MRVMQVHCGYRVPAGEDTVALAEADLLERYGHTVLRHHVRNPERKIAAGVALTLTLHNPTAIRDAVQAVTAFRPDVVHVHNTWFGLGNAVLPAIRELGVPVVMTAHNYRYSCISVDHFRDGICTRCVGHLPLAGVRHACYKDSYAFSLIAAVDNSYHRLRRTLLRSVDRIIAPSQFVADRLIEAGIPDDRLVVKPHFVEPRPERPQPASASNRVVFVGRLAPGKGVEVLLRAWDRLGRTDLELVLAGDGDLMSELRESAPRGVTFLGWTKREDVFDLLMTSRAMVFPSEWFEPFGMVLIEAMAAGLPVLVSDIAATRSIVDPDPRLLAVAGDDRDLADRLRVLLDDDLIDRESRRVRERQHERFSPESNIGELEAVYRSVMA